MSVLNPDTNRYIKVNSQKHKRLIKEGKLPPYEPPPPPAPPSPSRSARKKLARIATDVASENQRALTDDLSDSQMDALLKKMLYAKLCGKPKKPKKKKKKPRPPSSSDSSDSDSD